LAETHRKLASDLERIAAANLVLDEEREKYFARSTRRRNQLGGKPRSDRESGGAVTAHKMTIATDERVVWSETFYAETSASL
jgi:hypothetical protein